MRALEAELAASRKAPPPLAKGLFAPVPDPVPAAKRSASTAVAASPSDPSKHPPSGGRTDELEALVAAAEAQARLAAALLAEAKADEARATGDAARLTVSATRCYTRTVFSLLRNYCLYV